jgi:hypothetical protein
VHVLSAVRRLNIREALGQCSGTGEKDPHQLFTTGRETELCVKAMRQNADDLRPGDGMNFIAFGIAKSAQMRPDQASALLDLVRTPAPKDQHQDERQDGEPDPVAEATQSWTRSRNSLADDVEPGQPTPVARDGDEADLDDEGTREEDEGRAPRHGTESERVKAPISATVDSGARAAFSIRILHTRAISSVNSIANTGLQRLLDLLNLHT